MGHPWSGSVSYRAFGVTSVSYQNTSILMRIVMYPECTLNDTVGVTLDAYQDTSGYLTHSRYMRDTYEIHVSARVIKIHAGYRSKIHHDASRHLAYTSRYITIHHDTSRYIKIHLYLVVPQAADYATSSHQHPDLDCIRITS